MLLNPIIAMLHNLKLERWHPITFREAPSPGPWHDGKPVRHKSSSHHTAGFETRTEALAYAEGELSLYVKYNCIGDTQFCLEKDFPWDGEGVPAMVVFFGVGDDKVVPLLS